jgi:hypothetical protein
MPEATDLCVSAAQRKTSALAAPQMAVGEPCDDSGIHLASPSFLADATNHL